MPEWLTNLKQSVSLEAVKFGGDSKIGKMVIILLNGAHDFE